MMKSHNGNAGLTLKDVGPVTFETLEKFQIPYDEIYFGKPEAHVYIDDMAVNSHFDTQKELGWEEIKETTPKTMVAARPINVVQIVGESVVKSSKQSEILGEVYFYAFMPEDCASIFPALRSTPEYNSELYSVSLELVRGVSFSPLLVNRALTPKRLQTFLSTLRRVHLSNSECSDPSEKLKNSVFAKLFASNIEAWKTTGSSAGTSSSIDIYLNYLPKLEARYQKHYDNIYKKLGAEELYDNLRQRLTEYRERNGAIETKVIHGDPVLSNAVLTPSGDVRFFDMRGIVGEVFTTMGDCLYDLAKVYQSLMGYDLVLLVDEISLPDLSLSQIITERDEKILEELRSCFWKFVETEYGLGEDKFQFVKYITSSLYFTLLPYHSECRWPFFFELAKRAYTN
eukprot:TRINITY_DN3417_c0_g1_i1.p1 TRINITY_DN3417_c0_g1~~TRINITY_DN3417_c0_g1_i1.p1  ORF type:complete len:399 (+),score=57.15 TRINITY_DN3417_c0_g1_i1:810-2006(+)